MLSVGLSLKLQVRGLARLGHWGRGVGVWGYGWVGTNLKGEGPQVDSHPGRKYFWVFAR